jgi:putative flavoprotein involved in K+ transport
MGTGRPGDQTLDMLVVGGSQAGLAIAWHLARQGLRYAVLEAGPEIGHAWRSRWDSLTLFTPAQYDALPGMPFPAPADTYPTKDPVAGYLQAYASALEVPVRLNARVTSLSRAEEGFEARTADQVFRARQVVVDESVTQLHSAGYRNPRALPAGPVLVVGGGNSGFQIAGELAAAGRRVDLSIATKLPVLPQRLAGKDLFWWLTRLRLMRVTTESRLGRRMSSREFVIGGSRRRLQAKGVRFRPRLTGTGARSAHFADGTSLDVGIVVWATGYRSDHSWIQIPGVARDGGQIAHKRGVTEVPGLYFLGLSWQHTRGSALLGFVGDDAAYLAGCVAAQRRASDATSPRPVPGDRAGQR